MTSKKSCSTSAVIFCSTQASPNDQRLQGGRSENDSTPIQKAGGGSKLPIRISGTRDKPAFELDVRRALTQIRFEA